MKGMINIMTQNEFIEKIGEFARADMKKSGILASLTIAQAILESGWGKYDCGGNNLFGIKGRYNGQFVLCDTKEWVNGQYITTKAEFRKYPSWAESLADHSAFICGVKLGDGTLRYKKVIGEKDYKKACIAIHEAGYATSPVYAQSLINLIEKYNLNKFDIDEPVKKTEPKPIKKSNEEIAKEVLQGKWGNGNDRKQKLIQAGYDYSTIQSIVNTLCGQPTPQKPTQPTPQPVKKSIDDIARAVIRGEYGNGQERKNRLAQAGYDYATVQAKVNQLLKKG